jgi:hypothetical protein
VKLAEATRQYQIATEYRRTVEQHFDGTVSAADEVDSAFDAQVDAMVALEIAWLQHSALGA